MKFEKTSHFGKCYDLDAQHIERMARAIATRTGAPVEIVIDMGEAGTLSGSYVEAVLNEPLLEDAPIESLRLTSYANNAGQFKRVSLYFKQASLVASVRLSVVGTKDGANTMKTEVGQMLKSSVRWYWPVNYSGNGIISFSYLIIAAALSLTYVYFMVSEGLSSIYDKYPAIGWAFSALVFLSITAIIFDIRKWVFPPITFRLGASKRSAERRDAIRKFLFSSLLVGTALSIIGSYSWEAIQPYLGGKKQ